MPRNKPKELDASCLIDLDVRKLLAYELKQIPCMINGMWESGAIVIAPEIPQGDSRYVRASLYAVVRELGNYDVYFDDEKPDSPYVVFVPSQCVSHPRLRLPLKHFPATAKAMLKIWQAQAQAESDQLKRYGSEDLSGNRIKNRSKYTDEWMENVANAWMDSLKKVLAKIEPPVVEHEDLHCDNSEAELAYS